MTIRIREPINSMSHLLGAVLSLTGLIVLLAHSIKTGELTKVFAALVFGLSLIALYSASTIYHWVISSDKVVRTLRKLDHCMIYVLIAGTYTPICLLILQGKLGIGLLIGVWALAFLGIILKLVWLDAPRWLSTGFYLLLGWLSIFFIYPLAKALPWQGVTLLVLGGVLYSVGAVFYGLKPRNFRILRLGFHEIFHVFILLGSTAHYFLVYHYVISY